MKKLNILLVDDDADDREFFADALKSLDMNTELHEVDNGKTCLEFLHSRKDNMPNLIFLDLNMPIMNGFQCLEKIKSIERYNELIIAIYSTSSSDIDIEETFSKGANIYIKKPSSFKDLKNSLKQVIETNWSNHMSDFKKEKFLLKV